MQRYDHSAFVTTHLAHHQKHIKNKYIKVSCEFLYINWVPLDPPEVHGTNTSYRETKCLIIYLLICLFGTPTCFSRKPQVLTDYSRRMTQKFSGSVYRASNLCQYCHWPGHLNSNLVSLTFKNWFQHWLPKLFLPSFYCCIDSPEG